jgi:RimJ/RimL family protein N-acetyltransferase
MLRRPDTENGLGTIYFGYWVVPSERAGRHAIAAIDWIKLYCFNHQQFHKLVTYVLESNTYSIKAMEDNRFKLECVYYGHVVADDDRIDVFRYTHFGN